MNSASAKWMLNAAWILLATTLLINCFSPFVAVILHNKTITEINHSKYSPSLITKRSYVIVVVNVLTVITIILGIGGITLFLIKNI
jgi:uncharacterized membrane protein